MPLRVSAICGLLAPVTFIAGWLLGAGDGFGLRLARALQHGQTALDAAESIHSDIARGFIRAEVIRWDDLLECGSHAEAARRGLQRLEGKTYVVEDGDVVNVRFNV